MKTKEIVDFVLEFHNCRREYEIAEVPNNALREIKDLREFCVKEGIPEPIDTFKKEHGEKWDYKEYLRQVSTQIFVIEEIGENPEPKFFILLFPSFFKLPLIKQLRLMVHEARHIVDYPNILKPNKSLDYALLKEFLRNRK